MAIKVDSKKINAFFGSLNRAEQNYVQMQSAVVHNLNALLSQGVTKEKIMEKFNIVHEKAYQKFMNGNMDYDLKDLAIIDSLFAEIKMDQIANDSSVKFPKYGKEKTEKK